METTALPYPDMALADIVTEHRYVTERLANIAKFQAELDIMDTHLKSIRKQMYSEKTDKAKARAGLPKKKCKHCNQVFYGTDYPRHTTDGRCERSRTCKNCTGVFSNMMAKHRHKKNCI